MQEKGHLEIRTAQLADLPAIVALLADDDLGHSREVSSDEVASEYLNAFREIENDTNNEIIVGVCEAQIMAALQLMYIPSLTLKGTKRAQIEGVRVSSRVRGRGFGRQLIEYALARAKQQGCKLVQLTTNKARTDAIRFYESIGFESTHEGMKLNL